MRPAAQRPSGPGGAKDLASAIADLVRVIVREELAAIASPPPAEEWIDHRRWPCTSRRRAAELARSGAIPARRQGRLWLARRADLDAWVASGASATFDASERTPEASNDDGASSAPADAPAADRAMLAAIARRARRG